jgi:uncharacterized protein
MEKPSEKKFIADAMLGRLSKWLRTIGYDTIYYSSYREGMIEDFISEGRLLLSRNIRMINKHTPSLYIESDHAGEQIREIVKKNYLPLYKSQWFSRCLRCNVPLKSVPPEKAHGQVPEFIILQNTSALHFCPSCGRFFWPGTHKTRMMSQLSEWLSEYL